MVYCIYTLFNIFVLMPTVSKVKVWTIVKHSAHAVGSISTWTKYTLLCHPSCYRALVCYGITFCVMM